MRKLAPAALGAALLVLLPAAAEAHGLVQRPPLPIPQWLFAWAAAAVLVISFFALAVLWPTPRLEQDNWRPLPFGKGWGSLPLQILWGALGIFLLAVTVLAGYIAEGLALNHFSSTFILITFWVGLVFISILFGDVFRALSPWRALGRLLPSLNRPYPEKLGRWPAAILLFAFVWIELVGKWGETNPSLLVTAALGYTVLTLAAQCYFGVETWTRNGEAFAVYFGLFARMSVFETRGGTLGLRRPLGGLPRLDDVAGTVAFVMVMIGTVTFDGLSQGQLWRDLQTGVVDSLDGVGIGVLTATRIAGTLGMLLGVLIVWGFYRLGIEGARSVGGNLSLHKLEYGFVHSLVPIAAVYVAAHYLTLIFYEGQAISYLASDPFEQGWNLFGTVDNGIDYTVFPQENTWYVQVAVVVIGHVAALALAHDRALTLYGEAKLAVRSQYWMLGVMVGFTSLALWLLAQGAS
ncbi:fenitrothion hydrolase [Solirubrobacter sp. CPCC 204708]|uniref:Fenitrothion hydrolase n=1 Tax=Solirubrobacter deserti TaxID=2282478 RepID=A0ABT4RFW0_9ACTN|nr:fenitrothion hydrolase [Solirubrobacter deserti]MBE2318165.1 fenitrothion hydrolase [Solirubrobacter deserti]MDA0137446.1 fenitrothion hydrolase [Solirubrobacter deserti]